LELENDLYNQPKLTIYLNIIYLYLKMTEIPFFTIVKEKEEIYFNSCSRKDSVVLNKFTLNVVFKPRKIDYKNKLKYHAILGKIECASNEYLILVSNVKRVGSIIDANIYKIESVYYCLI
jgi:hypothetical protein